jgi:hypothetical protein
MLGSFSVNLSQFGFCRAGGVSCDLSRPAPHFAFPGLTVSTVLFGEWSNFPPCAAEFSLLV